MLENNEITAKQYNEDANGNYSKDEDGMIFNKYNS
jgi:hypothetical protein